MGLLQNFESTTGLSVKEAYHKIIKAEVDYIADRAVFWIAVYVSQIDRDANRTPLYVKKVVIEQVNDSLGLREKLYDYLKTTNDYQEAEDA